MNLEISVESDLWNEVDVRAIVSESTSSVFSELEFKNDNIEICFLFTDNEEVCLLNKTYRGVNKPTNVLSFPTNLAMPDPLDFNGDTPPCILGSIALAYQTIRQESVDQKKSFINHLKHLIVHGILHLFGYDHVKTSEARRMESLEVAILKKLNVSNPYQ